MNLDLPFPDAITDLATYANTVHEARMMLVGLLLLQCGAVALWYLGRTPRPEASAMQRRWRWVLLPAVAGACFGAAGPQLGHILDGLLGGVDSDLLPLAFLIGSLAWLAGKLARSSATRPMARLQLANALVWLVQAPAWMLSAGRYWDDLVLTMPLSVAGSGVLLAAVFVACRRWTPGRAARDVYDTRWARRLATGVSVLFVIAIAGLLVDQTLDETRPWRHYAKPIASLHVWNESMAEVDVSLRPAGSPDWERFDRSRIGPSAYGYSHDEATPVFPGEHKWTYRDTPDGQTEAFDLQVTSLTGRDHAITVPGLVVGRDEHLRLRVDDEGRVWLSRGADGWMHAALFGDETLLPTSP